MLKRYIMPVPAEEEELTKGKRMIKKD